MPSCTDCQSWPKRIATRLATATPNSIGICGANQKKIDIPMPSTSANRDISASVIVGGRKDCGAARVVIGFSYDVGDHMTRTVPQFSGAQMNCCRGLMPDSTGSCVCAGP